MALFFRRITFLLAAAALISACTPTQSVVNKRYFWPPPPTEPRIEWIGAYSSESDLKKAGPSLFELVVGEESGVILERPISIASDGIDKVYVADAETSTAYIFDFKSEHVSKLGGEAMAGVFEHLTGLSVDGRGFVYAANSKSRKIFVVDPDNKPVKVLDLSNHMTSIGNFTIDKTRNRLILPDVKQNKIVVADLDGAVLFSFGNKGDGDGEFNLPLSVAVEKDGGIVVCDSFNARIQRFTNQGKFVLKFGQRGDSPGDFSIIKGVAVDSEGHIYVSDGKANRITIFSSTGELLLYFGRQFSQTTGSKLGIGGFLVPQGIYIDPNDRIYISDQLNRRFQIFQYLNETYLTKHPLKPIASP